MWQRRCTRRCCPVLVPVCVADPALFFLPLPQVKCGNGASEPTTVPVGHYSTPITAPATQRSGSQECDAGYWYGNARLCTPGCCVTFLFARVCVRASGVTLVCATHAPPERTVQTLAVSQPAPKCAYCFLSFRVCFCFGARALCCSSHFARSVTACCSCPAGFYCPAGSSQPEPCGGTSVYCPGATGEPQSASAGYFTTPADGPTDRRTGQSPCRACLTFCTVAVLSLLDAHVRPASPLSSSSSGVVLFVRQPHVMPRRRVRLHI